MTKGTVQTVLGPVAAGDLGVTLAHEHLRTDAHRVTGRRDQVLDDASIVEREVREFRDAGGGTIVEVTPPDLGRSPATLAKIAQATGVHVVMATGRYREPFYEASVWTTSTAALADLFTSEIAEGVNGIRAGIIGEIGVEKYHISPVEERIHRAAARAQLATGVGLTTHVLHSTVGIQQLDLFEEEKVDLNRVAIGHCDSYLDSKYHLELARRGAFVQFDLIRGLHEAETQRTITFIQTLADAGFVGSILLSQDVYCNKYLRTFGGNGYTFIIQSFVPRLAAVGFSEAEIDELLRQNPRRFLAGPDSS